MVEAYTNLENMTKYYKYGANMPFNFYLMSNVNINSKPSEYKKSIDEFMEKVPEGEVANWVVNI